MTASLGENTWQRVVLPVLPDVPAMISRAERRYYYWLARERFAGVGELVELGCWLGGSTISLAAGLRDAGSKKRVTCIDRFTWAGEVYDKKFAAGLRKGDDFEPLFRANTAFLAEHIQALRAEIGGFAWNGGPIELLLVDAPKQRDVVLSFLAGFGPHLIPGRSRIAFQDYMHGPSFALPAVLSGFDELRLVDVVLPGTTVGFELTRPLDLDAARLAKCDPAGWSAEETLSRWAGIVAPLPEGARARMALGLPLLLHVQGHLEAAREEARRAAGIPGVRRALGAWQDTYMAVKYRAVFEAVGIEVRPSTAEMHYWVSNEELQAGRREAAMASAREALRLNPQYAPAQARVAMLERQEEAAARRRAAAQAREQAAAIPPQARAEAEAKPPASLARQVRRTAKAVVRRLFGARPD